MSNYITIKLRRGTAAQWTATNPVLAEGEFGAETDTRKFKIGNGSTAWNSLQYWGGSGGGAADFIDLGDVPASYSGQAGKFVKVKSTEDGLEFGTLTVAISDVTGLSAALSNLVPYSGASGDINLGEFGVQLGNLEFDNTPTNTPATDGSVFWDSGDGTLQLQMKGGATQKIGMNSFARIYNDSGVQLVKGDVVYISGAQGNRIAAKKAQANTESTAKNTFAIVVETIAAGAEGTVITEGPLYQLNTLGLTAGATLYLSPTTAGGYTETQPQAPDHLVIIGFVERVHGTVGSIYVKIANGYELEELHDVDLTESKTTPVDADALLLQDSADSSIWKRLTWANLKATLLTYFNGEYVAKNANITPATKTKITYDAKGLVTAGADATTADIADSTNRRYVTDGQLTVIGNTSGTNTGDQTITLTGDVTGTGTGSFAATIANKAVTLAKIQDISTARILGRVTAATGVAEELTGTQATTLLDTFTSSLKGLAPASGGGTSNFLRADGTWAAPSGGGGVSDGDKGDITVSSSGTVWTVDNDAISYAKMQNVSAASRLLGRGSAGGSGDVEEITIGSGLSLSGTELSATGGGGGGTKTYAVFTALDNQPPATNFATLDTRNSIAILDYDAATAENGIFIGIMPEAASLGSGLIVRLHWMATSATSGDCRWSVAFERMNTDLDSDSFDTAVATNATTNGTSGIPTVTAITVTTIDGITAGDAFRVRVQRDAANAGDTMTGDAELIAVEIRSAA